MPKKPKDPPTGDDGPEQEPERLTLDARTFTSAERLECQTRFDAPFGDLLRCIFEAVDPARDGASTIRIIDRDGTQHFPDQIIQFMLWVQAKRDDPDADLADFDDLTWGALYASHVRGLSGKARATKPSKRSRGRSSAGSSPA